MAELDNLKRLVSNLVDALEPFASVAEICDDEYGDVFDFTEDDRVNIVQAYGCLIEEASIEDFRAARRAINAGREALK